MRLLYALLLTASLALASCDSAPEPVDNGGGSICRTICTTGKACGDSCIARSSTCTRPPGTACNG